MIKNPFDTFENRFKPIFLTRQDVGNFVSNDFVRSNLGLDPAKPCMKRKKSLKHRFKSTNSVMMKYCDWNYSEMVIKKPIYARTCTCEQNECVRSESKQKERKTFGLHQFKIQFIKYFSRSFVGCIALYDACLVSVEIVFALSLTSDLYLKLNLYLLAFHMFQHLGIFPFRCLLYQPINNLSMCAKRAGNSYMRTWCAWRSKRLKRKSQKAIDELVIWVWKSFGFNEIQFI